MTDAYAVIYIPFSIIAARGSDRLTGCFFARIYRQCACCCLVKNVCLFVCLFIHLIANRDMLH